MCHSPGGSTPFFAKVALMLAIRSKLGNFLFELDWKLPKPVSEAMDGGGILAETNKNLEDVLHF